jgi:hypothetical protein
VTGADLDRLVGMPYRPDFNCAHFVEHVQREVFGREVRLPGGGPRNPEAAAQDFGLVLTAAPADGDLVLMFDFGRSRASHVGLWFLRDHEPYVLHSNERDGCSVFHRLRDLHGLGLRLEGFYRFNGEGQ